MKRLSFLIAGGLFYLSCFSQAADSADRVAASYFAEARQASLGQKVWSLDLYGPILFVDGQSRTTWANEPDSAGILKPAGGVYRGILPNEVLLANTAITWEGKQWSLILWPLPANRDDRANLMLHECFHRIQERLGLPQNTPTANHLSTMDGRIYYLLELQALRAALSLPVDQRGPDLANALLFREKRHVLFPVTFDNERILETSEGLAEYTGVILGRQPDSIRQHLFQQIDSSAGRKSLIRSFEYVSGPVYGYLLFEKDPRWTSRLDSSVSLPALISAYYHPGQPKVLTDQDLTAAVDKYNGKAIIHSEQVKEEDRRKMVQQYVDLFTRQPTVKIELEKMNISFNPSILIDLEEYGTIYPIAIVKDTWGRVEVTEGGLLMKDWKVIWLPLSSDPQPSDQLVTGKGWKLALNKGWKIVKSDKLHYIVVQGN